MENNKKIKPLTKQDVEVMLGYEINDFTIEPVFNCENLIGYSIRVIPVQPPEEILINGSIKTCLASKIYNMVSNVAIKAYEAGNVDGNNEMYNAECAGAYNQEPIEGQDAAVSRIVNENLEFFTAENIFKSISPEERLRIMSQYDSGIGFANNECC